MQDFFCVKRRNFFALFEHFAQKYPYFPKSRRCGERFSLFFANSMVFTKKPVKTKKPANAKRADRQKHAKKHRAKAVFFQVRTQGRLAKCPLGICAVRRQSSVLRYFVFEILHCVQNDKSLFGVFCFLHRGFVAVFIQLPFDFVRLVIFAQGFAEIVIFP